MLQVALWECLYNISLQRGINMKFTIGTASSSMEFEEDIRLIKSSLLYADEIELIGMAEYAIFSYLPKCLTSSKDFEIIISNLITLIGAFDNEEAKITKSQLEDIQIQLSPFLPYLKKKKRRNKQEILAQLKFKDLESQFRIQLSEAYQELVNNPGINHIQDLVDRNIINIYDYSYNGFSVEELTGGYFANLLGTIKHGGSYPLFDSISASVVSSVTQNKFLDFSKMDKEIIRHAGIAHNILSTLPTLEKATIDEILDFKKDMQTPLISFRKAIYGFTEKITSMPWDDDFCYECIKLYDTEVMPRVEEINELSSETSVLKNFGKQVLHDEEERKKLGYVGAGLITTITTNSNIFDALNYLETIIRAGAKLGLSAAGLTAFLKTADILRQAHSDAKEKKSEMESNVMYYYYKASKEL